MGPENPHPISDAGLSYSAKIRRDEEERVQRIDAQILEAKETQKDKEVFDFNTFMHFYSIEGPAVAEPEITEDLIRQYESEYYLSYPEAKSIREYAELRTESDKNSAG